jgi:hypothetical protein
MASDSKCDHIPALLLSPALWLLESNALTPIAFVRSAVILGGDIKVAGKL